MSHTEQMREAFERYFLESRKSKGANRRPTFDRMTDGTYADDHQQRHWWTWQNAQAALTAPAAEVPEAMGDAERYRWLRKNSAFSAVYIEINGSLEDSRTLDLAIDAAMSAQAGGA